MQQYLKDVSIETDLKLQEYGAYVATTLAGKYEGMVYAPSAIAVESDGPLYGAYTPESPTNVSHVNDPKLTAMLKAQRRTKELEARRHMIFDIQRYAAE